MVDIHSRGFFLIIYTSFCWSSSYLRILTEARDSSLVSQPRKFSAEYCTHISGYFYLLSLCIQNIYISISIRS